MCGVAGFLDTSLRSSNDALRQVAERMGRALQHRGPDSSGCWTDETCGIAFSHRRLAVIDVSSAGHQPMISANGRYVICFNGEIYNHVELRKALSKAGSAPDWRGYSDTETILAAVSAWGLEETLVRSYGMFAFALWDRKERSLHLARDRIGEKPLYYGWLGRVFVFASEVKALRRHPAWKGDIDRGALTLYMRHGYVPDPYCIHVGLHKLLPGTTLRLDHNTSSIVTRTYWSPPETVRNAVRNPFRGTQKEAIEELHSRLSAVVAEQIIADVPLGAFLSGGIDSSTIVALMQAQSSRPVRTFTIGSPEQEYNEAVHAKAIANHLGTDHTELYLGPRQALDTVSRVPYCYDEPFGDSSQIPTLLLSELTSKHVTVALSGDGGDELFGGYDRYRRVENLTDRINLLPPLVGRALGAGLRAVPTGAWDVLLRPLIGVMSDRGRHRYPGRKVHKWAEFFTLERPLIYRQLASHCSHPADLVLEGAEYPTAFTDPRRQFDCANIRDFMMSIDLVSYLPDDILVKVDRAAMSVSLETRIPLLDPRIVEFAWSLPGNYKFENGQTKWALRQVLYRYVPRALIDRPKQGFALPIEKWLRGPLRTWAQELLDPRRLREEGMLSPQYVSQAWEQYLSGDIDLTSMIWNILMFQAWVDLYQNSREERGIALKEAQL